ncbi:MAG: outer membrane beta-barrel protein [Deltaproteobacteria bacterium]|nr:outer membrane beta-barrel protein [Deltaproteobacteria bacterium]
MKKTIINVHILLLTFFFVISGLAFAEGVPQIDNKTLQSALSTVKVSGGASAGYFYASNTGEDADDDAFLLSNFMVEASSTGEDIPIGFAGAFGETSTPSVLGTPVNNDDFKIEYASLSLKPVKEMEIEMGLLQPNSGFENTYTFNNNNVILGAVASQQPYNAYGARGGYKAGGISLWGGYYKQRLDEEEYNSPAYAWEAGISGSIADNDFSIYNYHIYGQRNLLGAVIERSMDNIDLAFNVDYWTWDSDVNERYGSESSIGAAFYICPSFGSFSIPLRLEYIDQDKSGIYIESSGTKQIYAATVSPTWHYNDNAYVRAESAYTQADGAFLNDGQAEDNRINLAIELGFLF